MQFAKNVAIRDMACLLGNGDAKKLCHEGVAANFVIFGRPALFSFANGQDQKIETVKPFEFDEHDVSWGQACKPGGFFCSSPGLEACCVVGTLQ